MNSERLNKFLSLIKIQENGCWIWNGRKLCGRNNTTKLYGYFNEGGKFKRAHRVSYEHFKGFIPYNLTVHHICNNGLCVNPEHLNLLTLRDNILEGNNCCAINARKTHCPKGHELSGDNILASGIGHRTCRICNRVRSKEWKTAQRASK